ncbi:YrhK family protein [Actinomycetospora flava]|uniref:YrhK family protein n=1 Tax=Actinomycetospora flava TaxID=3129232 RepID=A0ABU8M8U5_9PSEU
MRRPSVSTADTHPRPLVFVLGHHELLIRRRYEVLSIINDILIAVWFTIGSFMFFSDELTYTGTWLFVLGSIELLIRPVIRLVRQVHLQRLPGRHGTPTDLGHDF